MRWMPRLFQSGWNTVQIEISTVCNSMCGYCPRSTMPWQSQFMPMELYHRILPNLERVRHVHLQGWGEPLLHPHFLEMITLAKAKGCSVSTTTCGSSLDDSCIQRLIDAKLDVLAISVAGAEAAHNRLRPSTSYAEIHHRLQRFAAIKAQRNSRTPHVHLAWLCTVSDAQDVTHLPAMMESLGIHEATVSGLSLVAHPDLQTECFAALAEPTYQRAIKPLTRLLEEAFEQGLAIHTHIPAPIRNAQCPALSKDACVISVSGHVAPCILATIPALGGTHWYADTPVPIQRISFGSLAETTLDAIRKDRPYRDFYKQARKGHLPPICATCYGRHTRPVPGVPVLPGDSMKERLEFLHRYTRQSN